MLIAKRAANAHQGGLWEFPGGKCEEGETLAESLNRELKEELGIEVESSEDVLTIDHDYGDKCVQLCCCLVTEFAGKANGLEGTLVRWATIAELEDYAFPDANQKIIAYLVSKH